VYAQYALAYRHLNGEGTPQSNEEYQKWITKSAIAGHLPAQFSLGCDYFEATNGVEKNLVKAEILLKRPAQNGNSRAQLLLGRIYKKGGAVPKDEKKAFELFELCAEREPEGRYELGLCYYNSIGVKKSYYKALKYIKEASDAGVQSAQKFIEAQNRATEQRERSKELLASYVRSIMYEQEATIEDLKNACEICEQWSSDGDEDSKKILGKLYYWLSVAYSKADACLDTSDNARIYMEKSAEQGYEEAKKALEKLGK
jgi:TPR repeat protein